MKRVRAFFVIGLFLIPLVFFAFHLFFVQGQAGFNNALVFYRSSTGTGVNYPKARTWDGSAWSSEAERQSAGSPVQWVRTVFSPVDYDVSITVTLSTDGYLDAYVWTGTAWSITNNIAFVGTDADIYRCFDVSFETSSGDALLVYGIGKDVSGNNHELGYKTWSKSTKTWSSETTFATTNNICGAGNYVYWVKSASHPSSDEIMITAYCKDTREAVALVWGGSSVGNEKLLTNDLSDKNMDETAIAYEQTSGTAHVIYGDRTNLKVYECKWHASSWDSSATEITSTVLGGKLCFAESKAEPCSNKVMLMLYDEQNSLWTVDWDGSSWGNQTKHVNQLAPGNKISRSIDGDWEDTYTFTVFYGTQTTGRLYYKTWHSSGGWGSESYITTGGSCTFVWVQARRNPLWSSGDAKILIGALDPWSPTYQKDLYLYSWDGSTLTEKAVATSDTGMSEYECFAIGYNRVPSNRAPTNDQCTITDMDDTDNLYAQKKDYTINYQVTDLDGYADIDYMEVRLKQGATTRAAFRYDEDTNLFTIQSGDDKWELNTGGSSAVESGNTITATFKFSVEWDATEEADVDIECYVCDDEPSSDTDTMQTDYVDVVTTLTVSGFASSPIEYVNPSSSVTFSGNVRYVDNPGSGTASSYYPPNAEFTAVHIHDVGHASKGSDNTIVNGAFSVTFTSDATVGQDTYHPYIDMTDADCTDFDVSGVTDTITVEQVKVISYSVADSRVNVNDNVNVDVTLDYASDSTDVTTGSVTVNGVSATHIGSGVWRITVSQSSVTSVTYNTVAASGNARSITSVNQNGQTQQIIWDQITVRGYSVVDTRVNINDNVNIDVTIEYEFDDTDVTDGTVTINTISATHQGSGVWRITQSKATVQAITYNTVACSGNTLGITSVNQNGQSGTITWDRIQVQSYTVSDPRVNINDNVNVDVLLYYDYDNAQVTDGTVTINGISATHQGSGTWRIIESETTVTSNTYNLVVCSGNTYGITAMDQNSQSTNVVWDRLQVTGYSVSDSRTDINDNVDIDVTIIFDYDDTACTTATITINGYGATHLGGGVYRITRASSSVTAVIYDTVACSAETTHGVTTVDQNSQSTTVIWDKLTIDFSTTNTAPVLGETVTVSWTIIRQYDSSTVTSFTIQVTRDGASWYSGSASLKTDVENTVVSYTYTASAVTDNDEGLASFDTDSVTVSWTKPSVETSTGTGTAEFESDQGSLTDLSAVDEATLPTEGKPNIVFPHGFFSFKITGLTPGAMVTVTITLPSDVAVGTEYWKYGPTLIDPTDHWYQLPMGSDNGDNVITITLVDGGLGDDDLTADGVIIDEGGPGKVPAPSTSAVGGIIISVSKLKLFGILLWVNAPITAALAVATASAILAVKKLKHRRGKARND